MTFIETVPPEDAAGSVAELYDNGRATFGRLPNFVQALSLRPEVYAAWAELNRSIKAGMELRRYELVTIAAARRLRSSYCMLAHGTVLADTLLEPETVRALATDHHAAGLDPVDVAVMDLADKVAADASSVTQGDIDGLRAHGLSDADILDVVLAAAARCFWSTALDGIGVQPDAHYAGMPAELRDALTVGRPIAPD